MCTGYSATDAANNLATSLNSAFGNLQGFNGASISFDGQTANNKKSKALAIGLGVGLGVGIPVVVGLVALVVITQRRKAQEVQPATAA